MKGGYDKIPLCGAQKNKAKQTQFKVCPERSRMGQFQNRTRLYTVALLYWFGQEKNTPG